MAHKLYHTCLDLYHPKTEWALLGDTYGFTMAQAWAARGLAERRAIFYASFRKLPENVGYAIFGGAENLAEWIRRVRFTKATTSWLATLKSPEGERLFHDAFLRTIAGRKLSLKLDSVHEGEVVFPYEPLIRGEGPLWELAFVEGMLLNVTNQFSSKMSKAARMVEAAGSDSIADNCLRRGLGIGGSVETAVAVYRAGVACTSNMLASRYFGIPPSGTMAHCFVVSFEEELDAFLAFAEANPGNTVFLVDTYNTSRGIKNAIRAGLALKQLGRKLHGIRLDSGDLCELSKTARQLLDEAGFSETRIVGTNSLDEFKIAVIKTQGAKISAWAAGDAFADAPLLGIVWKASAIADANGKLRPVIKLSEQKTSIPGMVAGRRMFAADGSFLGDVIYDAFVEDGRVNKVIDPRDSSRIISLEGATSSVETLQPLVRNGLPVMASITHETVRARVAEGVGRLAPEVKRPVMLHHHPVGMTLGLHERRTELIKKAQGI